MTDDETKAALEKTYADWKAMSMDNAKMWAEFRANAKVADAKRERAEIALKFAVAQYGGRWSTTGADLEIDPDEVADLSFDMADAFIEARDSTKGGA